MLVTMSNTGSSGSRAIISDAFFSFWGLMADADTSACAFARESATAASLSASLRAAEFDYFSLFDFFLYHFVVYVHTFHTYSNQNFLYFLRYLFHFVRIFHKDKDNSYIISIKFRNFVSYDY